MTAVLGATRAPQEPKAIIETLEQRLEAERGTRAAANSSASGIPSSLRQIWRTSPVLAAVS